MHLTIVIPTFNRIEKLERCIQSILKQTHQNFDIYVMADNYDTKTYRYIVEKYKWERVGCILNSKHSYVSGCWNLFTKLFGFLIYDNMLWCVDDLELHPTCLAEAVKTFEANFPDGDGVVGINHICPGHPEYDGKPYAFNLIGKKFIKRYPDGQVCCPFFTFFYQDEELYEYANSLGKFKFCKEAMLNHYHPCFCQDEMDSTHSIPRGEIIKKDKKTYEERQKRGLVWGKTWESVEEYDAKKFRSNK